MNPQKKWREQQIEKINACQNDAALQKLIALLLVDSVVAIHELTEAMTEEYDVREDIAAEDREDV